MNAGIIVKILKEYYRGRLEFGFASLALVAEGLNSPEVNKLLLEEIPVKDSPNHRIVCGDFTVLEKISPLTLRNFLKDYYFFPGEFPHQRLGQAFLNKYYPGLVCSELFYEEDNGKAEKYIWESFVDFDMSPASHLAGLK